MAVALALGQPVELDQNLELAAAAAGANAAAAVAVWPQPARRPIGVQCQSSYCSLSTLLSLSVTCLSKPVRVYLASRPSGPASCCMMKSCFRCWRLLFVACRSCFVALV